MLGPHKFKLQATTYLLYTVMIILTQSTITKNIFIASNVIYITPNASKLHRSYQDLVGNSYLS